MCLHLNPLLKMFDDFQGLDFNVATQYLEPILHCICLVWAHSRYYCLSKRIVTLLKMFGNSIVEQVYFNFYYYYFTNYLFIYNHPV